MFFVLTQIQAYPQMFDMNDSVRSDEIYDFLTILVAREKLDTSLYLDFRPASNCTMQDDSLYLYTLDTALIPLFEAEKHKYDDTCQVNLGGHLVGLRRSNKMYINASNIKQSLSKEDIAYMLWQKQVRKPFTWNTASLGFNKRMTHDYYDISIPLFSRDKSKIVIMIEKLCPGLCGEGYSVMYTKRDGIWLSDYGSHWLH